MSDEIIKGAGLLSAFYLSAFSSYGFYKLITPETWLSQIFVATLGVLGLGLPNFFGILSWYGVIGSENQEEDDESENQVFKASLKKYSL